MREIMVSREDRVLEASWPEKEALAVDLREARISLFSRSTCFWTVLKFLRASSWGRRRKGCS